MAQEHLLFGDSNPRKKNMVEEWVIKNVDYTPLGKGLPVCFTRNTSFYLTELPDFSGWPLDFKARVHSVLVDTDMKEDLERAGVINWSRNVGKMIPITVPRDGNCLLHSVALSVWGILDQNLMLRRLLQLVIRTDKTHRFYNRWIHHRHLQISQLLERRPTSEAEIAEWNEVSNFLDPTLSGSAAAPHRFLESIHVYVLANIMRRPIIIMTDPTMRAFSGFTLQDNDMGGIYLPLEWRWHDTNKTPILIGYSQSHFCPLLLAAHPNRGSGERKELAALVNAKFEQLPVRFLLQGEEPEVGELLGKYLKIKETVTTVSGVVQNILCAGLEIHKLPSELNLLNDYFKDFYTNCLVAQQYDYEAARLWQAGGTGQAGPRQLPAPQSGHLFQNQLGQRPVPTQHAEQEQLQGAQGQQYGMVDPSLQVTSPFGQGSVRIPPPSFNPRLSSLNQNASLNAPLDKKCVVPNCKFFGDPDLAMMCSSCFRNYSIKESRNMAASHVAMRTLPSAPLASIQGEQQPPDLSMMNYKCRNRCGYRCSVNTYPYCHECAEIEERKARESQQAVGPLITPGSPTTTAANASATITPPTSHHPASVSQEILTPVPAAQGQASLPGSPHPADSGQPQGMAASPGEVSSPTQALAATSLSAPLTPPNDPSDLMLFGSGTKASTTQPADAARAQEPNTSSSQTGAGEGKPSSSLPQVPATSEETVQQLSAFHLPVSHQKHQAKEPDQTLLLEPTGGQVPELPPQRKQVQEAPRIPAPTQQFLSSKLTDDIRATVMTGKAGTEPIPKCKTSGCENTGEIQLENLCAQCFLKNGIKPATTVPAPNLQVQNLMSALSITNSAPPSIGPTGNFEPSPAHKDPGSSVSRSSSLNHLPNKEPPLSGNKNYVRNWLDQIKPPASSGVKGQQVGLPEKLEGEQLTGGGSDLLASGEACQSYTERCIGKGCNSEVQQGQQLCQKCQDILQQANLGQQLQQSSRTSVQESSPPSFQLCRTEGCMFYCGNESHLGYCSQCHSRNVKMQQEAENRLSAQKTTQTIGAAQLASVIVLPPNIRVPPKFHHVPFPQERQGKPCKVANCNMFGDPKQLDLCGKHYQEHVSHTAEAPKSIPVPPQTATYAGSLVSPPSSHHAPQQPQQPQQQHGRTKHPHAPTTTITIPYASQVTVTPNSAFIIEPTGNREPIFETISSSSGVDPFADEVNSQGYLSNPSFDETYNRVAGGGSRARCLNPQCNNYGNSSNDGLCNSCAKDKKESDDLIGWGIYGEEQTG